MGIGKITDRFGQNSDSEIDSQERESLDQRHYDVQNHAYIVL